MADDRPLSQRLKDDNWQLHQIAERTEGSKTLMSPSITREEYAAALADLLPVHKELDRLVAAARDASPAIADLVRDDQMQAANIEADLRTVGRDDLIGADPSTLSPGVARDLAALADHADDPLYVLGRHYVRTGQTNGNAYLARRIRKVLQLGEAADPADPRAGTHAMDPFGAAQRETWARFKAGIDTMGAGMSEAERDRVFAGTRDAYLSAICGHDERPRTAEELLADHADALDKAAFDETHTVHQAAAGS